MWLTKTSESTPHTHTTQTCTYITHTVNTYMHIVWGTVYVLCKPYSTLYKELPNCSRTLVWKGLWNCRHTPRDAYDSKGKTALEVLQEAQSCLGESSTQSEPQLTTECCFRKYRKYGKKRWHKSLSGKYVLGKQNKMWSLHKTQRFKKSWTLCRCQFLNTNHNCHWLCSISFEILPIWLFFLCIASILYIHRAENSSLTQI